MASYKYTYEKEAVLGRLELEIRASSVIVTALDYMTALGTTIDIYFKAELSSGEVTALDAIVAAHTPTPLPDTATLVAVIGPKDDENRPYSREVVTQPDFHYSPRSLDFYTSKYNSLYNKSHYCGASGTDATIDGSVDLGDGTMKFYNASNTLLVKGESESDADFQIRLTANCVKTVVEFEPTFNYDVLGAKLQVRNPPTDRAYFWFVAAPDVPAEYGGNVVFMGGGMNLHFFSETDTFECDGKTVSRVAYDNVYHSGKLAAIVKHNVGVQIGIQLILQFFSAH